MKVEEIHAELVSCGFSRLDGPESFSRYQWECVKPHGTLIISYFKEAFYCPKVKAFLNDVCIAFTFDPEPVVEFAVQWAEGDPDAEEYARASANTNRGRVS